VAVSTSDEAINDTWWLVSKGGGAGWGLPLHRKSSRKKCGWLFDCLLC
jgi:hypothetical protein